MSPVDISTDAADEQAKPVLRRLLELNAHEFSAFDGRDVNEHGEYGYRYLDQYWTEPDHRQAFLIRCDGQIAGFAMVLGGPRQSVSEFFILRKYRRRGVGAAAAQMILRASPGHWVTHQVPGNDDAVAFWRRAIPVPFAETMDANGTTQRFTIDDLH
ncbi:MAG: hypothetical protein QOK14_666 [Frankiaceae bacterium]|jgi:predicted acetyltransferase|nr:hypothetical protein [Frankiaceae bacterium]